MNRRKVSVKYGKERAVVSDFLPFEVPLTFTNRHFYNFLVSNRIEQKNNSIIWDNQSEELDQIVHILFSLKISTNSMSCIAGGKKAYQLGNHSLTPFTFKINHKINEFRELSVPHPRCQIAFVEFYDIYKETILYYSSISDFSIRKPVRVAAYKYFKDQTHYLRLADDLPMVEEKGQEYESLRSFFVYKEYSNVYKFYESYLFHRCEKKYNKLRKLDVSKCFDSVYTHSITWAILSKSSVKENIGKSTKTFAGKFDSLMQLSNAKETNGIIIGPEASRIFAELILQAVDKNLELALESTHELKHKVHYEIFRYVDDYFIFSNAEEDFRNIEDCLQHELKKFKLSLNSAKAITYEKPIITEISRAKQRILELLRLRLDVEIEERKSADNTDEVYYVGSIYINANRLITDYKTILKECCVDYKDMLNYTLALVERRCDRILKKLKELELKNRPLKELTTSILAVLDFSFFISSVSPRVNTTIRLCRVVRMFTSYMSSRSINPEFRNLVLQSVYDNSRFILRKNKTDDFTQVETLYLLIAISELGKDYWLEQDVLASYFNIHRSQSDGELYCESELNYFSYTVILFYMKNKKRYADLREFIESSVIDHLEQFCGLHFSYAEKSMLGLDFVACPYVSTTSKSLVLEEIFNVSCPNVRANIINFKNKNGKKQMWFTTWGSFNFGDELDAKRSQEVY